MVRILLRRLALETEQVPFFIDGFMMKNAVDEARPRRQGRLAHYQSSARLQRGDCAAHEVERTLEMMQHVEDEKRSHFVRSQSESVRVHNYIDPGTRLKDVCRYDIAEVTFEVARSGAYLDHGTLR